MGAWKIEFQVDHVISGNLENVVAREDENVDKLRGVMSSKFCCRNYSVFPMKLATRVLDV